MIGRDPLDVECPLCHQPKRAICRTALGVGLWGKPHSSRKAAARGESVPQFTRAQHEMTDIARCIAALDRARKAAKAARGRRGWESHRRSMIAEALQIRRELRELTK